VKDIGPPTRYESFIPTIVRLTWYVGSKTVGAIVGASVGLAGGPKIKAKTMIIAIPLDKPAMTGIVTPISTNFLFVKLDT